MAGKLTFAIAALLPLIEAAKAAPNDDVRLTFDQLFDPKLRFDGKKPKDFDAKEEEVDKSRVGRGLILVGDDGIYLMANVKASLVKATDAKGKTSERMPLVFADQCNPDVMEFDDWYDAKRRIFGGDDGTIALPCADFILGNVKTLKATGIGVERMEFVINLNSNSLSYRVAVRPEKPAKKPSTRKPRAV